jgi:hypothetical protein
MATPISPTPILKGKDAIRFINMMNHNNEHVRTITPPNLTKLNEALRIDKV